MLYKRATKELQAKGCPDLEVHKCLYGVTVRNKQYTRQRGQVFADAATAIAEALRGNVPVEIKHTV